MTALRYGGEGNGHNDDDWECARTAIAWEPFDRFPHKVYTCSYLSTFAQGIIPPFF